MASLRDRVKAFFNPTPLTSPTGGEGTGAPAPVIPESVINKFQVERTRNAAIKDCRGMYDADPRVEKMHRDYARDLLRNGFLIQTTDAAAKQIADELQERLGLNQKLEDWLRLTMRDGDSFLEVSVDDALLISGVTRKPTLQVHRNSNAADQFENPDRAFWMAEEMYAGLEPPKDAIWFPVWKMIHARWNHDEEQRYGRPMMKSARKSFKYVEDGELNVAVRRKIGGAQIRSHFVDGSPADVEKYKADNQASLGKLAAVIDLFSNKKGTLEVHQGDGNLDKIADVEHHIATMFTASDIPMELIAYGGELNRDILGEKKAQYEEILNQGREWASMQLIRPLLERQWLLQGILPASVKYKVIWRKAKTLSPADLRDLADAGSRLKVLGVKDEIIQVLLATFLRDVDVDILNSDGFSAEQFAKSLQGISI
ncbi:MAG: hypothetical protein EHM40_11595 [Chloroflexi bacterium]|nr:MAG: hypothetical protein EHM40_11595 [Chloroflexota bacterium]